MRPTWMLLMATSLTGPCNAMQLDAELACVALQRVLQQGLRSTDLTGVNTLYASDWSGNAFVDFRMPLGAMELFAGVDVNYRSDFMSAGDNDEKDCIDAYTKVNARIGFGGERWESWPTVVTSSMRRPYSKASIRRYWRVATPVHGRGCGVRCARNPALLSTF